MSDSDRLSELEQKVEAVVKETRRHTTMLNLICEQIDSIAHCLQRAHPDWKPPQDFIKDLGLTPPAA